ncbi:hypothetical protein U0070_013490 [Myodes glareolus]|uniref:Uncharacterized protein n=1 Tax=Myodes glareolus TaxID=447135 RepID=A0AAW0HKE8_MYOGA
MSSPSSPDHSAIEKTEGSMLVFIVDVRPANTRSKKLQNICDTNVARVYTLLRPMAPDYGALDVANNTEII